MNTMLRQILRTGLILFLIAGVEGCKDKDDRVPYVLVDITLYLDLPEFANLVTPGGYATISGGSMGIVIYRRSEEEFSAFDRHCTHKVSEYCRIHVDENTGITAICECCGSVFSIYDGIPVEGEAQRSLLRYNTNYNNNTKILYLYN